MLPPLCGGKMYHRCLGAPPMCHHAHLINLALLQRGPGASVGPHVRGICWRGGVACHAVDSLADQAQDLDREQRGLLVQLERTAARNFRLGNYESISKAVEEQDSVFEAARITSSFKTLAAVDQPDDAATREQQAAFVRDLCDMAADTLNALHPSQMVTLLWSCGRLNHHPGPLLEQLSQLLLPHVPSLRCKQLTLVAWSLAKLGGRGAAECALLDAIAEASTGRATEFVPLGLANLVWSFGRLRHPADAMLAAIAPQAAVCIDEFDAQQLCNLMYGLAVLQRPLGPQLSAVLPDAVESRLDDFTPQGLSLSAWALSGLQMAGECFVDDGLLDGVAERAVALAADFNPLDTCNLLVAFARFEFREDACLRAVCSAAAQQQQPFGRLEAIGTFWSLGKLEFQSAQLLPVLAAQIQQHLPVLDVWEVSNVITACSRLQFTPQSTQLLPALMRQAQDGLPDARMQTLANLSTALARLPKLPETRPLAEAVAAEFCRRRYSGSALPKPEEVVNVLSGHARTGTADSALCTAAVSAAAAQLDRTKLQHISTLLHGLGKARYRGRGKGFASLLRHAVQLLMEHAGDAPVRELATVLWGLARLSPGLAAITPEVGASLAARLREFNTRDIVFVAFACSQLRDTVPTLPQAIAAEIESRGFGDFRIGEVAYICRALAVHKALSPPLLQAVQDMMRDDAGRFEHWQLVHIGKSMKMQAKSA